MKEQSPKLSEVLYNSLFGSKSKKETDSNPSVISDENGITVMSGWTKSPERSFVYMLLDDKMKPIEVTEKTQDPVYCFVPEADGIYGASVVAYECGEETLRYKKRIDYYSSQTRQSFADFLQGEPQAPVEEVQLVKMEEPFQNFAVRISSDPLKPFAGKAFLEKYALAQKKIGDHAELLLNRTANKNAGLFLSGFVLDREQMRYGQKDYDAKPCPVNDSQAGWFTYIHRSGAEMEIGSDYFGIGRLYYYQENSKWTISNNFWFLLMVLKEDGRKLSFDYEQVLALFLKQNQMYQQTISRNREIKGCVVLPISKKIIIKESGEVILADKEIQKDLFSESGAPEQCDENSLYESAIAEIRQNILSAYRNPKFKECSVTLTGGMDSRCVFAAVKTLERDGLLPIKNRLSVNTMPDKAHIVDAKAACYLNNGKYPWNCAALLKGVSAKTSATASKANDEQAMQNRFVSLIGGEGYFAPLTPRYETEEFGQSDTLVLTGYYGGAVGRPCYTKALRNRNLSDEKVIGHFASSTKAFSAEAMRAFWQVLENEVQLLPGKDLIEKIELHYLFYRNALHFGCVGKYQSMAPNVGPLMSRSLFHLKRQNFDKWNSVEEQIELLDRMGPENLAIPLDTETYEEARTAYLTEKYGAVPAFDPQDYAQEVERFWATQKKPKQAAQESDADYLARLKRLIYGLAQKNEKLKDKICLPIWSRMEAGYFSPVEIACLMKKMLTLLAEANLMEDRKRNKKPPFMRLAPGGSSSSNSASRFNSRKNDNVS